MSNVRQLTFLAVWRGVLIRIVEAHTKRTGVVSNVRCWKNSGVHSDASDSRGTGTASVDEDENATRAVTELLLDLAAGRCETLLQAQAGQGLRAADLSKVVCRQYTCRHRSIILYEA